MVGLIDLKERGVLLLGGEWRNVVMEAGVETL
jgi:hypothetical protein